MTNSLVQNIEQNKNNDAIDLMMQSFNTSSQNKTQEQSGFSNLISKLDARTQKAQSDFDKKAKVTNTSSINKKALDTKEVVSNKKIQKNTDENELNNDTQTQAYKKETKDIQENNSEIEIKEENKTISKKEDKKEIKSEELSDINNSSPVMTSPVFSSDETNEATKAENNVDSEIENSLDKIDKNIQELINVLPVINSTSSTNEIQKTDTNLKDLLKNIENIDELPKIIENVSSELNNSTLNQEQKNELSDILSELKEIVESNENSKIDAQNFSNELAELKNKIDELFNNTSIKNDTNIEINNENELSEIKLEIEKPTDNTISVDNKDNETIQEATKLIEEISKDIEELKNNSNSEKLDSIKENLDKLIENIKTTSSEDVENSNFSENIIKPLENLKETVKNLKTTLDNSINSDIEFTTAENNTNTNNQDIFETLDKLNNKDLENIDIKDENTKKEIINLLDNLNDELKSENSTKEIKEQIESLIEKINTQEISPDELNQTIKDLSSEIETNIPKQNNETTLNQSTNTIDLVDEFKKFSNNENFTQEQNNQNTRQEDTTIQDLKLSQNNKDNTIDADFDFSEVKLKGKIEQDTNIDIIEQNLQKTVAIENMLDEMMVEVDIKNIPSNSGALSVSDEIAKLAMGEVNSLTSNTSIHGSITYDATGINAVIKNAAALVKTTTTQNTSAPSMEDILNQVTNKITQLKDGATQKLTMVLRPNDLGRLSIELISNQDGLTTQIMAQNDDVRAYIEKNINSLRQQLTDAGVNVNNIQIKTQGQEGSTNYEGNQNLAKNYEDNQNQQNNENKNNNQQRQNDNKESKDILASISNYDMSFAKDFSSVLNKSISYSLN